MRLASLLPPFFVGLGAVLLWAFVPWQDMFAWGLSAQRDFQEATARALRAVQAGEPAAIWALCSATAAYGFVHALGPGHGKVLLGGAAFASGATIRRMSILTVLASLAQSLSAIALVGAFAVAVGVGTRRLGVVADTWLAPASYGAICAVGLYLVYRGVQLWRRPSTACCGHEHGPTVEDTVSLTTPRDAVLLIGSIALRPCTGALFLLAIALRFDVFWVGCLAVLTMGLGTAAFNLLVAWSGVAARRASALRVGAASDLRRLSAGLHMVGGASVAVISLTWLFAVAT